MRHCSHGVRGSLICVASQCDDEPGKPSTAVADNTQRIRCRIKYFVGLVAIVPFAIVVGKRSHASADVFNMYVIQFPNHPDEMCGDPWLPTEKGNFHVSDFRTVGLAKATLSQTKVFVSGTRVGFGNALSVRKVLRL